MRFRINGQEVAWDGDPDDLLLDYLRDDAGITSPKCGCSPQANCGTCCVEIDGKAQLSCAFKMKRADGCDIRTLEGIDPAVSKALSECFAGFGGTQCGFCTPGIAVRAAVLLRDNPALSRDEIAKSLKQHICR